MKSVSVTWDDDRKHLDFPWVNAIEELTLYLEEESEDTLVAFVVAAPQVTSSPRHTPRGVNWAPGHKDSVTVKDGY